MASNDIYSSDESDYESSNCSENVLITKEIKEEEIELKRFNNQLSKEEKVKLEEEQRKVDKEKALKSMRYLLNNSKLYSNFIKCKLQKEKEKRNNADKSNTQKKTRQVIWNDFDDNITEELTSSTAAQNDRKSVFKMTNMEKPIYFEGGELRDYQLEGVAWVKFLYKHGLNGILADEMGLGKTIQVIALICHLIEECIGGPFLIVAPLSTIPNWINEFKRFAPKVPIVLFHGNKSTRESLYSSIRRKKYEIDNKMISPVVITTYQVPLIETKFLQQFLWKYIIVDEGQRIKNHKSLLSRTLSSLKSSNRLILTGTPLQNNLEELWALLNFLVPHMFPDNRIFNSLFQLGDFKNKNKVIEEEEKTQMISTLHQVLEPFMLRRLKSDVLDVTLPKKELIVYCPLTEQQYSLYQSVLDKNIELMLNGSKYDSVEPVPKKRRIKKRFENLKENEIETFDDHEKLMKCDYYYESESIKYVVQTEVSRITMANPLMMLIKITDHPYLVQMPLDPKITDRKELLVDENIIKMSGKMMILDALLKKLKANGHKVLLFSTLTMMLDLIEDYMIMCKIPYARLDGSQNLALRKEQIDQFNEDPNIFVFLLSTRAGGLGLNLTAADTVIFYDSDWNPQVDLQAQDRCHRIGQTKPVVVYKLVAKNTIDEKILAHANNKRYLEKIVISKVTNHFGSLSGLQELREILNSKDYKEVILPTDEKSMSRELDKLLDRNDLWKEINEKGTAINTS